MVRPLPSYFSVALGLRDVLTIWTRSALRVFGFLVLLKQDAHKIPLVSFENMLPGISHLDIFSCTRIL